MKMMKKRINLKKLIEIQKFVVKNLKSKNLFFQKKDNKKTLLLPKFNTIRKLSKSKKFKFILKLSTIIFYISTKELERAAMKEFLLTTFIYIIKIYTVVMQIRVAMYYFPQYNPYVGILLPITELTEPVLLLLQKIMPPVIHRHADLRPTIVFYILNRLARAAESQRRILRANYFR